MQPFVLAFVVTLGTVGQTGRPVTGIVVDSSGAPVPAATVRVEVSGVGIDEFRTSDDGRFEINVGDSGDTRIIVTAIGFSEAIEAVSSSTGSVEIVLQPTRFFEAVNVTSSRTDVPRTDPTATVTVFSSADLLTNAPLTIDDALKTVPGFTLFRRTSSRVSNPTAQGITLRGLGGTGSSRSLVLVDGVPLNDAFGGWVYWDRLPQVAIERIEVLRGSGSDLYGADAVGGVVQIMTMRPGRRSLHGLVEGGSLGTGRVSLFGGGTGRGWSYSAAGQWFTTDGYITVATEQDPGIAPRGPIDTKAGSTHRSALASLGYQMSNGWRFEARGNLFWEDRENGTPAQVNDTDAGQGVGEIAGGLGGGLLSIRAFGGSQGYDQTFSTISADRRSETLNRTQHVPTTASGVGGQWVRPWGNHALLFGAEGRFIDGSTIETPYAQGRPITTVEAGGTQAVGSAFVQAAFNVSDRLTIAASAHGDRWHSESRNTNYNRTLASFNPRTSFAYRIGTTGLSIRGSVYRGFRAPTLNELYRGFRAGSTETRPNEALEPEKLTGGDAGLSIARGRVSARVTGFWNVLDDAITNITLQTTPQLIVKQRANADIVRAAGVEFESDARLPHSWNVSFTSALVHSHFKGDTSLQDNRVPQVPKYNIGLTVRYTGRLWTGSGQLRVTGPQFEDDLNAYTLRRATVLDVYGSRALAGKAGLFVAVENLFNSEYDVGRTPTLTTGLPRAVRAGLQLSLSGR
jgi:outer membrane cobalamin receptor